jgi:hypothetical protein
MHLASMLMQSSGVFPLLLVDLQAAEGCKNKQERKKTIAASEFE